MITVTANAFHHKLHIAEEEIILNGPPSFLTGNIFLSNKDTERLFIRELPLSPSADGNNPPYMATGFRLRTSLLPGEEKMHRISHKLPATTPPGIYESIIHAGGEEKKVKMVVQPNIEIDVHPLIIHFTGVIAGESYYAQLSFSNTGNVAFKVPDIKHVNAFDEDYLCRAASLAVRERGAEGFTAMMDEITKNVNRELPGWATIKLEESGRTLAPGESIQLHITLTLPKNVDASKDYFGSVRLWNKTLSYHFKSH